MPEDPWEEARTPGDDVVDGLEDVDEGLVVVVATPFVGVLAALAEAAELLAAPVVVVVVVCVEALVVLADVVGLLEELPQAASVRLASVEANSAVPRVRLCIQISDMGPSAGDPIAWLSRPLSSTTLAGQSGQYDHPEL